MANDTGVVIIGGGAAGMEAACCLRDFGYGVTLLEKESTLGGHVAQWSRVFPSGRPAEEIISGLKARLADALILTSREVSGASRTESGFRVTVGAQSLSASAILIATGYRPFDATRKEEFGYGVYEGVVTSVDLEKMLKNGNGLRVPATGKIPAVVAINHCVGSRDKKVGNVYCSRVCCTYGINQAIEIKERSPETRVICFYMDIRAYGRGFEELYRRAQEEFEVWFIRGRIADVREDGGRLMIRAEDTLAGQPLQMHVDLLSLSVGLEPAASTAALAQCLGLKVGPDGFFATADEHCRPNDSSVPGVFLAGTASGPKSILESITDGRAAAAAIAAYLRARQGERAPARA